MKKLFSIGVLAVIGLFVFTACEKMGEDVGRHKGHKYVDLGLSVKWATCNVGANRPWEYGDYFAWGEVETKEDYYWHTYKYGGMRDGGREVVFLTKYCSDSVIGKDGFVDNQYRYSCPAVKCDVLQLKVTNDFIGENGIVTR